MQNPVRLKKLFPKFQKERMELAQKLRKAHMEKWIIEHYKQGQKVKELGRGYPISQSQAYLIAKTAATKNPKIDLARASTKQPKQVPIIKERIRQHRPKKFNFEEQRKIAPNRQFNYDKLIRHVSIDEYSSSEAPVSAGTSKKSAGASKGGQKEKNGLADGRTRAHRARIEAVKLMLKNPKGMMTFSEITNYLLSNKLIKNKNAVTKIMLELVEVGAIDRIPPRGFRIRDEWVKIR